MYADDASTALRLLSDHRDNFVATHTDITARQAAEARLRHDAAHDALTGLPNRVRFLERLEAAVAPVRAGGTIVLWGDGVTRTIIGRSN